jgi:hypothetical protein
MSQNATVYTGGCLCGALRYEASGAPLYAGFCYCRDCQKASGSGFIPFLGFSSTLIRFIGETRPFTSKAANGDDAVRNFCSRCGSLVFGGVLGESDPFTIYAGSLDDRSAFHPTVAIFARDRPPWVEIPSGLKVFETTPRR